MAEIPLYDENQPVPEAQPRAGVRLTEATIRPYPDGRRMKLHFAVSPFLERPSVDMAVTNAAGQEVASLSLIEAMDTAFDFTVHLRGPQPQGEHTLRLTLFYRANDDADAERQIVDERVLVFDPAPEAAR